MLPIPSELPDAVFAEPRDGSQLVFENVTGIDVRAAGSLTPALSARRVHGRVMISDARITFASSHFETALRRRRRHRGAMLVGQVRYPWLQSVHADNHGRPRVQLLVSGTGGETLQVWLTFRKHVDALGLAAELIRRAARFRLRTDTNPTSVSENRRFAQLAVLAPLVPAPTGQMAGETFPSAWPASEHTARFGM